jgi:hypothetical protein
VNSWFDVLSKAVAAGEVTRREALRRVGGAAAGALLASLGVGCSTERMTGPEMARRGCKGLGVNCRTGSQCCSGLCVKEECCVGPGTSCRNNNQCCSRVCADGQCQCESGLQLCEFQCVDTQTDPNNCGDCFVFCGSATCVSGQCQCEGGLQFCPNASGCVDTQTDVVNCGGCGQTCFGGTCVNGQCVCPTDQTFCADFGECCELGCCGTHCCCPSGTTFCPLVEVCCQDGQECCNTGCCGTDQQCCGECVPADFSCCPSPREGDEPYPCPPETPVCCGFFQCCPAA